MTNTTLSPELSFFPSQAPHEIVDFKKGEALIRRINKVLSHAPETALVCRLLHAKLDPFHGEYVGQMTYSVEIVPYYHLDADWFDEGNQYHHSVMAGLKWLFDTMRRDFDLVPTLIERRKGVTKHWPGGGCHLHYGADLFYYDSDWYDRLKLFHQNLVTDYANRPYIRWLFSQWFADTTRVPLSGTKCSDFDMIADDVWEGTFSNRNSSIEPRFMGTSKRSYLTFEFRLFSMVANAKELALIIRFLDKWMAHVLLHQYVNRDVCRIIYTPTRLPVTLNLRKFRQMCDRQLSWGFCENFLDSLGLPSQDYRIFYERNYLNRITSGSMI